MERRVALRGGVPQPSAALEGEGGERGAGSGAAAEGARGAAGGASCGRGGEGLRREARALVWRGATHRPAAEGRRTPPSPESMSAPSLMRRSSAALSPFSAALRICSLRSGMASAAASSSAARALTLRRLSAPLRSHAALRRTALGPPPRTLRPRAAASTKRARYVCQDRAPPRVNQAVGSGYPCAVHPARGRACGDRALTANFAGRHHYQRSRPCNAASSTSFSASRTVAAIRVRGGSGAPSAASTARSSAAVRGCAAR